MDPLTVLSLVGNVVQFVETAHILISKTVEGYRSLDGSLVENADAELVTRDLIRLKEQLEIQAGVDNVHLGTLCRRCNEVGVELLEGIQKVKGHGGRSGKLKSFRQAVRSVWSRDEIHSIEKRLSNIRDELNLQVCVDLRQQLAAASFQHSTEYSVLDEGLKFIADSILKQEALLKDSLEIQTAEIRVMHVERREAAAEQHNETRDIILQNQEQLFAEISKQEVESRCEIIDAIDDVDEEVRAGFLDTQQEIIQLKGAIKQLQKQIQHGNEELANLLREFAETRSTKKKKSLLERSNAVSATLLALEIMYRSLKDVLESLQSSAKLAIQQFKNRPAWRIFAYPAPIVAQSTEASPIADPVAIPLTRRKVNLYTGKRGSYFEFAGFADTENLVAIYNGYYYPPPTKRALHLVNVFALSKIYPVVGKPDGSLDSGEGMQRRQPGSDVRLPAMVWAMAIVTAALSVWVGPVATSDTLNAKIYDVLAPMSHDLVSYTRGYDERSTEDIAGQQPSSSTEHLLRSEIEFWMSFANERGIVTGARSLQYTYPDPNLRTAHQTEIEQLEWRSLLRILSEETYTSSRLVVGLRQPTIHRMAMALQALGLNIEVASSGRRINPENLARHGIYAEEVRAFGITPREPLVVLIEGEPI